MAIQSAQELKKIGNRNIQERILAATRDLIAFPDVPNVKRLINHAYDFRLRVGTWRILFNAFEEVRIVSIEEVKKRNERTY